MCTNITGQAVYARRNKDGRSRNHCCDGKTINITYSECVFAALISTQNHAPYYIVVCDLSGHAIFLNITFIKVLLTQNWAGDKIEKNEMGWACGAYG